MRCLFIDTSSFFINICIIENDSILFQHTERIEKDMSSKIMPIIKIGFDSINFDINDIDKIFVVNGPGSFTGVRVGVTVAKTIAWALKKDIITLSSLEVIASTSTDTEYNVGLIDARRGNVYAGVYDKVLNIIKCDQLINFEQLKQELSDNYTLIGENYNNVQPDVLKVINKHINDKPTNCHDVKPNYLKLTEAEEKFNDSRNN